MKNKKIIIGVVIAVVVVVAILIGGKLLNQTNNNESAIKGSKEENKKSTNFIEDNDSYFIIVDGKKFTAGDKVSDLSSVGYRVRESDEDVEVPANRYMIGAGYMVTTENKRTFSVTPYNVTDSKLKVPESVIGGVSLSYDQIKNDEKLANVEVYGGITLNSTMEEIKEAFGEPSSTYEGTYNTTFKYESDETYRYYSFVFDEEGKLSGIAWQNLVFNEK